MLRKTRILVLITGLSAMHVLGQTTTGLMTGVLTDSSGAVVPGAEVELTNQGTGQERTTTSGNDGIYLVLQLPPGMYDISVRKQGFATEKRQNIQLKVNQSVTLDFKLTVSSAAQTITVTGAAPLLDTTSSTLSDVVDHEATVDLPLNGRQFTQLALLTPGAAPEQDAQQGTFTVALGAGSISPTVNGQRGYQNNFTMDGALNNSTYTDVWAIAPPPDALQEFNVQSHITDAQFSVSSGANINVVTRSGTNAFHGALWEFLRNDDLDAQTFPATSRLPYRQNQYGLYFGGPVIVPHVINGRDNTWFSLYWEGFRSTKTGTGLSSVLTPAMISGNFSSVLGTAVIGMDSLGRPEYADEIYDPLTSRPDPQHSGEYLRDPFSNNTIPTQRLNPASLLILQKYYPAPNLAVAAGVLPNYKFSAPTDIASDIFGIRMDHQLSTNDTVFARFNRNNVHQTTPGALPANPTSLSNYSQQAVVGYTHIFNPKTILNFRYGYTYTDDFSINPPSGGAFDASINFTEALPPKDGISMGPAVSVANGYSGVTQTADPLGPQEGMDYHLDLSKIIGRHTLGMGGMYYHLRSYDDGWQSTLSFTQNATSQDASAGPTGYGPASFMLGALDSYAPWVGNTSADQTVNWYGIYAQDQWQVTKDLVLTAGLRWDYVSPPNYHRVVSGFNILTGQFIITEAEPPNFPQATGPSGYFTPQYNGYEPRFGMTYQAMARTVIHGAFAMLDDHNNTLVQENQGVRLSWPTGDAANFINLDLSIPTTYANNLPSASSIIGNVAPYAGFGANPDNKIPYAMEFNLGVQQQISNSVMVKLDYVGSLSRHQYITLNGNSALYPGPGPVLAREPYPQYGGPFAFEWNVGPGDYNALQAQVQKSLSSGLFFLASYTYSKSMDWGSDPYGRPEENFYDLNREWGPSTYSLKHMFVLSGVYELPVGRGKTFLGNSSGLVQAVAGDWKLGSIISLHSGTTFDALAGADVANIGDSAGVERAQRIPGMNPYASPQTPQAWLNKAAFAEPAAYTFGNESKDDLTGPAYRDIDFNVAKDFPLVESAKLQFRAEFFNLLNTTNYANPVATFNAATFGKITSAVQGREIQFALKVLF